jgi:hypothetical protein
MFRTLTFALLITVAITPVSAEVFMCADELGHTVFSDRPCPGVKSEPVDIRTGPASASQPSGPGLTEAELKRLADIEKREQTEAAKRQATVRDPAKAQSAPDPQAAQRQQKCEYYQRRIDDLREKMRSGYSASRSARYLQEERDYLDKITEYCR